MYRFSQPELLAKLFKVQSSPNGIRENVDFSLGTLWRGFLFVLFGLLFLSLNNLERHKT